MDQSVGEWTGIAKFTNKGWRKYLLETEQLLLEGQFNVFDTEAMNRLVQKERIIQIVPFRDLPFVEIDFSRDLKRACDEIVPRLNSS